MVIKDFENCFATTGLDMARQDIESTPQQLLTTGLLADSLWGKTFKAPGMYELFYNENKGDKPNMETLFNVIMVDKTGYIILDKKIVAKNSEDAKYKVGVYATLDDIGKTPSDVTIICNAIEKVRINCGE